MKHSDIIVDVRSIAKELEGPESTWIGWDYNAFNEKEMDKVMPNVPSRWDHIFLSKNDFSVSKSIVCDDKYEIEWKGERKIVYPSDHRPILMDFCII